MVGPDLLRLKNQEGGETWKEILPRHIRKYLMPERVTRLEACEVSEQVDIHSKTRWHIQLEGNSDSRVQQGQREPWISHLVSTQNPNPNPKPALHASLPCLSVSSSSSSAAIWHQHGPGHS